MKLRGHIKPLNVMRKFYGACTCGTAACVAAITPLRPVLALL